MNSDQNSVLSQNWVKCIVCTPMAQAARPGARAGAVSWSLWPAVSWAQWSCRKPSVVSCRRPGSRVVAGCTRASTALLWPCVTTQPSSSCPCLSQYTSVYCNTTPPADKLFYHNTIGVLQHTFPETNCPMLQYKSLIVIHFPNLLHIHKAMSRYNVPLYRDTVWAVAQISSCTPFFSFLFFSHNLLLKNTQKKHISIFFFSWSSTPNKLIKFILLIFFSFTHYKNLRK